MSIEEVLYTAHAKPTGGRVDKIDIWEKLSRTTDFKHS
jgi:hypothetical protein